MTYAELAEALKIAADSARNLVRRKRWPRQTGNDGLARIGVPAEHLDGHARPDGPDEGALDAAASAPAENPSVIAVLERHVERLEWELVAAVAERNTERARGAQVAALEAVLDVERQRVREAREEAERWQQLALAQRGFWAWLRRTGTNDARQGRSPLARTLNWPAGEDEPAKGITSG